jgi:O-antigen ligase
MITAPVPPEPGVWAVRRAAQGQVPARASGRFGDLSALVLITSLMLLYPVEFDTGRNNFSLGDPFVLLVAGVYLFRSLRAPVPVPRYAAFVFALIVVAVASATVNVVTSEPFFTGTLATLVETLKLVMAIAWMCVIFWLLSKQFARRFLQLACTSVIFATVAALGSIALTAAETTDARPSWPFDNSNLYGGYLCLNAFLALAAQGVLAEYAEREGRPPPAAFRLLGPFILPVLFPVLLLGVVSTGSRGALIGTVVGLALAGYLRLRSLTVRWMVLVAAMLLVAAGAGQWYLKQEPLVLQRLERTAEGDVKGAQERLMLWQAALDAFETHPLLGVGYGQFRNYAHQATGENKLAHETYLSIAAELGVAGLAVFGWLVLAILRDSLRRRRQAYASVTRAGRGFVLATLVQGLFANIQHSRGLWIVIGVLAVQAVSGPLGQARRAGRGAPAGAPLWRQP